MRGGRTESMPSSSAELSSADAAHSRLRPCDERPSGAHSHGMSVSSGVASSDSRTLSSTCGARGGEGHTHPKKRQKHLEV